jgi:hypothetical protein
MSNRKIIVQALERVRRRVEFCHALHDAAAVLGLIAVGLLLWRVLHIFAASAPVVAAAVLTALLLWAGGLLFLAHRRLAPRCTLGEAAASADLRACLRDELATAWWFLERAVASPWVEAQLARAAESARRLDPVALLPLRVEWPELGAGVAAVLLLIAAFIAQPVSLSSDAAGEPQLQAQAQTDPAQVIRTLLREEHDEATTRSLERALAMLERKAATLDQKRRALSEAEGAIAQEALEAAALRDGLYKLAAPLRGEQRTERVARALELGNAELAAKVMQELSEQSGPIGLDQQSAPSVQGDEEQELERLLPRVAKDEGKALDPSSSAAAREAADHLTRIAQRLAAQDHLSQTAHTLAQLRQAVAQDPSSSLPGSRQQAAGRGSDNANTGAAGPSVQQAGSSGPNSSPFGREGTKPGTATGDAQSDAVLGAKVAPLAVQLRRETIGIESPGAGDAAPKEWFYAETQKRASSIELEPVRARSEFVLGQSAALEGVAERHRQIVKQYFMALHQGARP